MPLIAPPFIPNDSAYIYRVCTPGHPHTFQAPKWARDDAEVVYPLQDESENYTMTLSPLKEEHFEGVERLAAILEEQAKWTYIAVEWSKGFIMNSMCAVSIMAWHLIDDEASITHLCNTRSGTDFRDPYCAVWTTLAVFRNSHALRNHLSDDAKHDYLHCYTELGNILQQYGVALHLDWE